MTQLRTVEIGKVKRNVNDALGVAKYYWNSRALMMIDPLRDAAMSGDRAETMDKA
jgi:hypothetical protein